MARKYQFRYVVRGISTNVEISFDQDERVSAMKGYFAEYFGVPSRKVVVLSNDRVVRDWEPLNVLAREKFEVTFSQ